MSTFTAAEVASIQAKLTNGDYPGAYLEAANIASSWLFVDRSVVMWLRGAAQINTGVGPFSDFVRAYTEAQYLARYGTQLSPNAIQGVSDQIAGLVLSYIITNQKLPSISDIAVHDAGPAATFLFQGDPGGWAGNPMFVALGHYDAFASNIVETDGDTYDALAMIKFAKGDGAVAAAFAGMLDFIGNNPGGIPGAGVLSAAAIAQTLAFLVVSYGQSITDELGSNIFLGRVNGADSLGGSDEDDIVNAGGGDDTIYLTGGDDLLDGGEGKDTASYSAADSVEVTIEDSPGGSGSAARFTGRVKAEGDTDKLFNIERIEGSDNDDKFTIKSFSADDPIELDGGDGEDTLDTSSLGSGITANAVTSEFSSSAGNARIENFEKFIGGAGNDTFVLTGKETSVDGGDGEDVVDFSLAEEAIDGPITLQNIELAHGSEFADVFHAGGKSMQIRGRGGADQLVGGGGDDILVGGDDSTGDTLTGGGGHDFFLVGNGDTVTDASTEDRLGISASERIEGEATREEGSEDPYKNDKGYEFTLEGSTLTIKANGKTITVQDFQDGDLGITLKEEPDEPEEPEEPEGPNGPGNGGSPFPLGPYQNPPTSPLVLDLDGDGWEISALKGTKVHFDLDATGSREATGWIGADDGFLVFDANSDGVVNNGRELFGNGEDNGFEVLSFYDGRTGGNFYTDPQGGAVDANFREGVIDANDEIYAKLQVWRDLDQDGETDAGELFSLASLGITSIDLNYSSPGTPVHEHVIGQASSGTTTTGTVAIADVWFKTDRTNTMFDHDPEVVGFEGWPDLHAIGGLRSLRHAMSLDIDLAETVDTFLRDASELSMDALQERFTDLLLTWAGVEDRPLGGRGDYFADSRILEFLELAHEQPYRQLSGWNEGTNAPGPLAAAAIMRSFLAARDVLLVQFLSQVTDSNTARALNGEAVSLDVDLRFFSLAQSLTYDAATGRHTFDAYLFLTSLGVIDFEDSTSLPVSLRTLDLLPFIASMSGATNEDMSTLLMDAIARAERPELRVFVDWYFRTEDASGSEVNPRGPARIAGEGAVISGTDTAYLIIIGEDLGVVTIARDRTGDRLVLTEAFGGADVEAAYDVASGDVTLTFPDLGTTLVLQGYLRPGSSNFDFALRGDAIYFPDGRVLYASDIRDLVVPEGTTGDDTIMGTVFDEVFSGLGGDDVIKGDDGDDVIDGGDGNDLLIGGTGRDVMTGGTGDDLLGSTNNSENQGADVYVIRSGDGHDILRESAGWGANEVDFEDLSSADIRLAFSGRDLVVSFAGRPDDTLTISNFRDAETISTFRFADGSTWSYAQIVNQVLLQAAGPGNDTITGSSSRDLLVGGLGDDVIYGAGSSFSDGDVFLYRAGDGHDLVHANYSYSLDELVLIGIAPESVVVSRVGDNVVLSFAGGGSITLYDQFQSLGWNVLEVITFDNGVVWSERDLAFAVQGALPSATVVGTSASETLTGTSERDGLSGGAGDDILRGGNGADTYFFGAGGGHDRIEENGRDDAVDADCIVLDAAPDAVTLSRVGDSVVLTLSSGETLTLANFFAAGTSRLDGTRAIEKVVFSNGALWDAIELAKAAWIRGGAGVDTLSGTAGSDTLYGAGGNDVLAGGLGDDVYVIRSGDGHDLVNESSGAGADTLWLQDAALADVRILRVVEDIDNQFLIIERLDGTGSVKVRANRVESVRFTDQTLNAAALLQAAVIEGSEQAEILDGSQDADQITGRGGADEIWGGDGYDTYHWSRGDGADSIYDFQDVENLGRLNLHGVDPLEVLLERVPSEWDDDHFDLLITIQPRLSTDVAETIRIVGFFVFEEGEINGITEILFDTGVKWTVDDMISRSVLKGTASSEYLIGTSGTDTINGLGGDDELYGERGSDTYFWRPGDGEDFIFDDGDAWDVDTLRLEGVDRASVVLTRDGIDLCIEVVATGEVLRIRGQFWTVGDGELGRLDMTKGLERIVFAEGFEIDRAALLAMFPPDPTEEPDPNDPYAGTAGDDYIEGTGAAQTLRGFAGNDTLYADDGDDTLDGGAGDDTLDGGDGADTYIYRPGDGFDFIWDEGATGADALLLSGFDRTDAEFTVDEYGLKVLFADGALDIYSGYAHRLGYNPQSPTGMGIETFTFDDITLDADNVLLTALAAGGRSVAFGSASMDVMTGSAGGDAIVGEGGDDQLSGAGGNDRLFGGDGEDILTGGTGDDELVGGDGLDTYVYAAGDGDDLIIDWDGVAGDILQFSAGLTQNDVTITRSDSDAILTFAAGGSVTLRNQFSGGGVDLIDFSTGTDWTATDLEALYIASAKTSGDDVIEGFDGDEIYDGGAGNDELIGREGADTYLFGDGYGHDIVRDWGGGDDADQLILSGSLASTTVTVHRLTDSLDDIVLHFATGDSVRLVEAMYCDPQSAYGSGVEAIVFSDSVIWTRQDLYNAYFAAATTSGDDWIAGFTTFDDVLTGGAGKDTFVFGSHFGSDVITDFSVVDDTISFAGYPSFEQVMLNAVQDGSDVVITHYNNTLRIEGVDLGDLNASHFGFEPEPDFSVGDASERDESWWAPETAADREWVFGDGHRWAHPTKEFDGFRPGMVDKPYHAFRPYEGADPSHDVWLF